MPQPSNLVGASHGITDASHGGSSSPRVTEASHVTAAPRITEAALVLAGAPRITEAGPPQDLMLRLGVRQDDLAVQQGQANP